MAWAQQCFRLAVCLDPGHVEAWNNLAVIEARRGADEQARRRQTGGNRGPRAVRSLLKGPGGEERWTLA